MAKNQTVRIVSTLERNNVTLGIFSNNLAAYEALKEFIPSSLNFELVSYSTVNRKVQESGQHIDITTPIGIFVISKRPLFRFHAKKNIKEIAGG